MQQEYSLNHVPLAAPAWTQLGVAVIDGSLSMTWQFDEPDGESALPSRSKAQAVDSVLGAFISLMTDSRSAAAFKFGFISFNDSVTETRDPIAVLDVSPSASYDPTAPGTGGTAIYTGLEAAARMVEHFMSAEQTRDVPTSAVVALLSDGEEQSDPARTVEAAQRLRELPNTQIATGLFATKGQVPGGERLLQTIASAPNLYKRIYNADQLRSFFHDSMTVAATGNGPVALLGSGSSDGPV
jgi:hypothetical protein